MIFVYLIILCLFVTVAIISMTRTVVYLSSRGGKKFVRLQSAGIGGEYDFVSNRFALVVGTYRHPLRRKGKPDEEAQRKKREKKEKKKLKSAAKKKHPKLTWALRVQIIKALALFCGRLLARLSFDIGAVVVRPTISNPALAGMAYGWGQAFLGAFPDLRRKTAFAPNFDGSQSVYEGEMTVSIKNRQIVALLWGLARDLPIGKIVKHKFMN